MIDETAAAEPNHDIAWPLEFPLSKVVQAHGEDTKVLVLREPTGDDVIAHGLLMGLAPAEFAPLVAKLAGVPTSTIKAIPAKDVIRLAGILDRFFSWAAR